MGIPAKILTGILAALVLSFGPAGKGEAMEGPESVELDSLAQYYEPVIFDHAMHAELTGEDCSICHHHTLGTGTSDAKCAKCHANSGEADGVACRDCHSRERFAASYLNEIKNDPSLFHTDKPGLKGAYHNGCIGCHEEQGGPVGCQDCHGRTREGDEFFHAGPFAPAGGGRGSGH